MMPQEANPRTLVQKFGLFLGPLVASALLLGPSIDVTQPLLNKMAAVAGLMAIWWMTEAVPLAVTSLLPVALYPLLAIPPGRDISRSYMHPLIFLFLGGFLLAIAIEESGLHRRAALAVLSVFSDKPRRLILGFMLTTAGLSMWISNTATTLMMLPIALSVIFQADRNENNSSTENPGGSNRRFQVALLLGIAYSASIGGIATLVGTPPNVFFKAIYDKAVPEAPISFLGWMVLAAPFSFVMLLLTWFFLVYVIYPVGSKRLLGESDTIKQKLQALGKMTSAEKRIGLIFAATAILWITREPTKGWGWAPALGVDSMTFQGEKFKLVGDGTIAILMAILCFIIPSGRKDKRPLITWAMTARLPWGILLLFGGGFALGTGLQETGLDIHIGKWLAGQMGSLPSLGMQAVLTSGMTFFTEITSNMASVNMLLPVLAESSRQLEVAPLTLLLPTTLAASCAFMLPVATAPNAIVYGTGRLKMAEMIKAGLVLNFLSIACITAWMAILKIL